MANAAVKIVASAKEWQGAEPDSDDEESHAGHASRLERRASASYEVRERRLSVAAEALKDQKPISDAEVEVVAEKQEWSAAAELEDSEGPAQREQSARASFLARERRLSHAAEVLQEESIMGDAEVSVIAQAKEWQGAGDSDDEAGSKTQFERRASASFAARERRLSHAAEALKEERLMGDVEVEVIPQAKEWQGAADSDEEEGFADEQQMERQASESFAAREKRLSVGAEVREEHDRMGVTEKEVEIVQETKEWGEGEGEGEEESHEKQLEQNASAAFRARERRLTVAAEALKTENIIGDVDVPVVLHSKEWAGAEDSDEDTVDSSPTRFERRASESFAARERRISVCAEVLKQEKVIGDTDVIVVPQASEWKGADDSDDDQDTNQFEKRASQAYTAREKRLSVAVQALQEANIIGDRDVQVVPQAKEWGAVEDSEDEAPTRQSCFERRASASFENREKRLTAAASVMRDSHCESYASSLHLSFEQERRDPVQTSYRSDRCSDRCTNMCMLM
eukprot:gb/GFBE01050001.1/.p1 GENE.gb/GFBE01050001.1/~~gb/GFBE01050001.1/.p1  ORF type:complete len:513 (+),score=131.73 gb/GFBE01050001.1/:1-1539(+)